MLTRVTAFLAACLFMLTSECFADTVNGTVVNATGVPMAGATIEVFENSATAITDATGAFTLNLVPGTYSFQVVPADTALFAPIVLKNKIVNGATNLGVISLNGGFILSGIVTDSFGTPIINGDLDVFDDETGIKLSAEDDKTTATGSFSLRVPAGALRLRAEPSTGLILVAQIQTVTLAGNLSVGTIVLPQGFIMTGTVVNSATSLPLAGVDIDVDDLGTGERIQTPGDNTDANGVFSVIVPTSIYRVSFEPIKGVQILLGLRLPAIIVNGPINIGTVGLDPGISISGTLRDSTGFPVANADLDVKALPGNALVYTPGDQTSSSGAFFVVIPTGSHRVIYSPLTSTNLVAQSSAFTTYSTSTNLGNVVLQNGYALSGRVTAFGGAPQFDCDVVIFNSSTGARIEASQKATDANGDYLIVVPAGTYDVSFETKKASVAQDKVEPGIVVSGPTILNTALVLVPMLAYVDDPAFPGPQLIPIANTQIFINYGFYNPKIITTGALVDVEVENPFGVISPILIGLQLVLGPGQYTFGAFVAVPLINPAANAHGLPHRFRIRLRDPFDNSVIDEDSFVYFPL